MKKVLIILALVLSGSIFANNSVEVEKEKNTNDECTKTCWAEVTNTETGQTYYFTGSATAGDCFTAAGQCIANLRRAVQTFTQAN